MARDVVAGVRRARWQKPSVWSGRDALLTLLRAETGSGILLLLSILLALAWANFSPSSYNGTWATELTFDLGSHSSGRTLREWVNSGLMTIFFTVVGLEARREFDMGELRKRSLIAMPLVVAAVAMALPVGLYVAVNGSTGAGGAWGIAMSTDTALALGVIGVSGRDVSDRLRAYLLPVLVVDDLVAIVVIAVVYGGTISWMRLCIAAMVFLAFVAAFRARLDGPLAYAMMGAAMWVALLGSGIDPVVAGLAMGLVASAYTPRREGLEDATATFRAFREEPTPELARSAKVAVTLTQSPNARLQRLYIPWATYVVVPIFGLANAGVSLDAATLQQAARSPVTWGIVSAFVVGKPLGHCLATVMVIRGSGGRLQGPVGNGGVLVSGTAAGAPFTLSLLIADLGLRDDRLAQAKIGVLVAAVVAFGSTSALLRLTRRLPKARRARLLLGTGSGYTDLQDQVEAAVDHIRGDPATDVTVVEYGDYECPHCGLAEPSARREMAEDPGVRHVWRHLPLTDIHPRAQVAAEASEAAAAQGSFWQMHDLLLAHQDDLSNADLVGYASHLGLDVSRFVAEIEAGTYARRIERDVASAARSGVSGTPTFFVNGRRHYGSYGFSSLHEAVSQARHRRLAQGRSEDQ